jgi:hypothetical protein
LRAIVDAMKRAGVDISHQGVKNTIAAADRQSIA